MSRYKHRFVPPEFHNLFLLVLIHLVFDRLQQPQLEHLANFQSEKQNAKLILLLVLANSFQG